MWIAACLLCCVQLRKHLITSFHDESLDHWPFLNELALDAADIQTMAEILQRILFKIFKECGIYASGVSLNSASWCPEQARTVDEELRSLISPSLVTYAVCIWEELADEERSTGEVRDPTQESTCVRSRSCD